MWDQSDASILGIPTSTTTAASGNGADAAAASSAAPLSAGAKAGIGVGVAAFVLLCAALVFFVARRVRGQEWERRKTEREGAENPRPRRQPRVSYGMDEIGEGR